MMKSKSIQYLITYIHNNKKQKHFGCKDKVDKLIL